MTIAGFININKKSGPTSHDIVAKIRKFLDRKVKVGHLGTLDPLAEGVLPIAIGSATRTFPYFLDLRKSYDVTMIFGKVTDTQDVTGKILEEKSPPLLNLDICQGLLEGFLGKTLKFPPMFSALSVGGKRLYELAREGIEVDREKRSIEIYSIQVQSISGPHLKFKIECSRGTYIRTLCHDLGKMHGSGGCMVSLLRTSLGPFEIKDSLSLDDFESFSNLSSVNNILVPPAEALRHLPSMDFSDMDVAKLRQGISLDCFGSLIHFPEKNNFRMLDSNGELVGIGKVVSDVPSFSEKIKIRPTKIFN